MYAALDLTTGKVIGAPHSRDRAIESKKFLQTLTREVPGHLDVHLVLDNSSTHKTPAIRRWLAAHPRFVLHFTPTSSSWLNLVERWFAELTNKLLRRGAHRSVRALNSDIRAWIDSWNDDPRPFVWSKTADQMFDSIARNRERITHHDTKLLRQHRCAAGIDRSMGARSCALDKPSARASSRR